MSQYADELSAAASTLIGVCMLRMLPFVAYSIGSKRVRAGGKLVAAGSYTSLGALALAVDPALDALIVSQAIAVGYSAIGSLGVCLVVSRIERPPAWTGLPLFMALCLVQVAAPAWILPFPTNLIAVPLGWELVLSSYSYLRDARSGQRQPSLGEGMFFLLVDPTLVFPERGAKLRVPSLHRRGLVRLLAGVLVVTFHLGVITMLLAQSTLSPISASAIADLQGGAAFVLYYALRLLAGYAAHSGTASLQIGMMRLLGYEVRERYHYPLLATSPADFWRRWNIYVGSWARRYVFAPTAIALRRRLSTRIGGSPVAIPAAVLITFAAMGVFHDFPVFMTHQQWPLGGLLVFGLNGVALLAWMGAERLLRGLGTRLRVSDALSTSQVWTVASCTCFLGFLVVNVWITVSTMSSE